MLQYNMSKDLMTVSEYTNEVGESVKIESGRKELELNK